MFLGIKRFGIQPRKRGRNLVIRLCFFSEIFFPEKMECQKGKKSWRWVGRKSVVGEWIHGRRGEDGREMRLGKCLGLKISVYLSSLLNQPTVLGRWRRGGNQDNTTEHSRLFCLLLQLNASCFSSDHPCLPGYKLDEKSKNGVIKSYYGYMYTRNIKG